MKISQSQMTLLFVLFTVLISLVITGCTNIDVNTTSEGLISSQYPAYDESITIDPSSGYPSIDNVVTTPLPAGTLPDSPKSAPKPAENFASISGTLFSLTNRVVSETKFYLYRAIDQDNPQLPSLIVGPSSDNGDIDSWSDINGQFEINNIPPGNYFLIVWVPQGWEIVQTSVDDDTPLLISLSENEQKAFGVMRVQFP